MSILGGAAAYITIITPVSGFAMFHSNINSIIFAHIGNQLDKMQGMKNVSVSELSIQRH